MLAHEAMVAPDSGAADIIPSGDGGCSVGPPELLLI